MESILSSGLHGTANHTRAAAEPIFSEESLLSLLIVMGSSVSLVGLIFAFITYSLFSDLRNLAGTALMNLLAALFMNQLLYVIGVGGVPDPELCISLAFSLHYIRGCVYCWMLSMTHHMYGQCKRNVDVLPECEEAIGFKFFKYSSFSWGVPSLFLAGSFYFQYRSKNGNILDVSTVKEQNCWFLDEEAFAYTSLLPAAVVLLLAVFYAGRTFLVARYMDNMQAADKRAREKTKRKRILQLALYARIAGVLIAVVISAGLTKFLGGDASWILYHIGQGLQGLLVALSVTCDCQILKLYTKSLRCGGGGGGGGGSFPAAPKNLTFDARHILGRDSALSPANSLKLLTLEIADPV